MNIRTWACRLPRMPIAALLGLMALGWLGIARAEEFAQTSRFADQQLLWCALGLLILCAATFPHYRLLERYGYAAFAAALGLLFTVYFFPPINGAHRWIR